jgi:23S rRNA pseudouridine2605 synthase
MEERLQKILAEAGVASRRKAEELIAAGRVSVNGEVVTEMGVKADMSDDIRVDGKPIRKEEHVYYLLNKPAGYICTLKDDKGRKTVRECMPDVKERIFPVGRLDYDTTGLIIMTNDGEFANRMMHPRYHLPKTYEVAVDGILTDQMLIMLTKGIRLNDGMTLPAEVILLSRKESTHKTVIQITIREGRNRQVRRMMEYFHCKVTRLSRIRYGCLETGSLRQGQYRKLRSYEVRKLIRMSETEHL